MHYSKTLKQSSPHCYVFPWRCMLGGGVVRSRLVQRIRKFGITALFLCFAPCSVTSRGTSHTRKKKSSLSPRCVPEERAREPAWRQSPPCPLCGAPRFTECSGRVCLLSCKTEGLRLNVLCVFIFLFFFHPRPL